MNENILLAYSLDGKGSGESLDEDALSPQLKEDKLLWVHMDVNHIDTLSWLEEKLDYLDRFVVDALLAEETRPRMMQLDNGILLILRGVNLNKDADPEDMVSIRLWIEEHRIISLRKRKLKAISDISEKINSGKGPKNAGQFVSMLTSRLFESMEPVLSALDETTDSIEEKVLEAVDISLRQGIVDVRKQAIMFHRYMSPQRDAIRQLCMSDLEWLGDTHKHHLQEAHNHVTRYIEDLAAIRERAQVVKDELTNMLADRMNKNMYILSIIAAFFLPLGFLTGLLGINVSGIPGADYADAFYIFCGILVGIVGIQILLFKKMKWF